MCSTSGGAAGCVFHKHSSEQLFQSALLLSIANPLTQQPKVVALQSHSCWLINQQQESGTSLT